MEKRVYMDIIVTLNVSYRYEVDLTAASMKFRVL
jgi:hypothetical protein